MTRIISGAAGSVRLAVPKSGTRPTSDRVREAIFSALDALDALDGARVLDLYAGSGALALEAVSRGASTATLVEKDSTAASIAKKNAQLILDAFPKHDKPSVSVIRSSVKQFLSTDPGIWDLVFVDPPYELTESELAENLIQIAARTAADALLIVERSSRSPEPQWPATFSDVREKKYGETTVWLATRD